MTKVADYDAFFTQATAGDAPFPFQRRVAQLPQLPGVVQAPTGAGKTAAVVLGWLWRRVQKEPNTPTRLIYCLPMRVLVDQVAGEARRWLSRLGLSEADVGVFALRGGQIDQSWEQYPERPAILVGTQDQLLSRALNRGFAMSRYRWPIHYALLNNDCWWVLDEVQLMGPGLRTAAQLQALRQRLGSYGVTGTTFMSATLTDQWLQTPEHDPRGLLRVALDDSDYAEPALSRRRAASKALAQCPVHDPKVLAPWIADRHQQDGLTLVVVNRVARAQELSKRLRALLPQAEHLLIHSRFRPHERRQMEARLSSQLPPQGRLVVATQTVEAGVDLSAALLVTDLAPWPSLVQRFGRCNRRGERADAQVFWVDVDTAKKGRSAPYEATELDHARTVLQSLDNARIADLPPVEQQWPNTALPRPVDVLELFDTDPDLDGNFVDVSRWIRGSGDTDVAVFWRELAGKPPDSELSRAQEPELCSVGTAAFREFAKGHAGGVWALDEFEGKWVRAHSNSSGDARGFISPGGQYLLDVRVGGYQPELGWDGVEKVTPALRHDALPPADSFSADQLSKQDLLVSLEVHLRDTKDQADDLVGKLSDILGPDVATQVVTAAGWHDVGKAHRCFQEAIVAETDVLLAKAPNFRRYSRQGFRHELVSALVAVAQRQPDLVAYLVAAHHGKVRLGLRPLQWEGALDGELLRGVSAADAVPVVTTPFGETGAQTTLPLQLAAMGRTLAGPSWAERVLCLLQTYGPFRLAMLETLVRIADWRASAEPSESLSIEEPSHG